MPLLSFAAGGRGGWGDLCAGNLCCERRRCSNGGDRGFRGEVRSGLRGGFALWRGVGEAFAAADAFEEELGYVLDDDVFGVGFAGGTAEHALAEGTAYGENFFTGSGGEGLLGFAEAVVGDALVPFFLLFPELGSAGSAAEGVFFVAGEFGSVV